MSKITEIYHQNGIHTFEGLYDQRKAGVFAFDNTDGEDAHIEVNGFGVAEVTIEFLAELLAPRGLEPVEFRRGEKFVDHL